MGLLNEVYWALKFVEAKSGKRGSPKGVVSLGWEVCAPQGQRARGGEKGERKKYF